MNYIELSRIFWKYICSVNNARHIHLLEPLLKLYFYSCAIIIAKHNIKYHCLSNKECCKTRNVKIVVNPRLVSIFGVILCLRSSSKIDNFCHTDIKITPMLTWCGLWPALFMICYSNV